MNLNMCWKNPSEAKMYLNIWCPNHYHASEDIKCISTCVDQTLLIPARTQNLFQHVLPKPIECQRGLNMYINKCWCHASEDLICTSKCVDQTHPIPAKTQNVSQNMYRPNSSNASEIAECLTCHRRHKMFLNMCWPNTSHSREYRKWISTCVYQTPHITAKTQNASQHGLTLQFQREQKWISACVKQSPPLPARTQNVLQNVLMKPLPG